MTIKEKEYVFIFGVGEEVKGVGAGFAHRLKARGAIPCIQYRSESKKQEILDVFPNAILFQSMLDNVSQLETQLQLLKDQNILPRFMSLSAGKPGFDVDVDATLTGIELEEKSEAYFNNNNLLNKQVIFDACEKVYADIKHKITMFVISSQAAEWSLEKAREFGQVGYHKSMVAVAQLAESKKHIPYFDIHILYTPSIDTKAFGRLKVKIEETGGVVYAIQNNEKYAEDVLVKIGLPLAA